MFRITIVKLGGKELKHIALTDMPEAPHHPGKVFYLIGDDPNDLKRRARETARDLGIHFVENLD